MYRHSGRGTGAATPEMSKASTDAVNKNVICNTALQKELRMIEKERARHMHAIRLEARQFRSHSPVLGHRSPSPGSSGSLRPYSGQASPRKGAERPSPRGSSASLSRAQRDGSLLKSQSPQRSPHRSQSNRGSQQSHRGSPQMGQNPRSILHDSLQGRKTPGSPRIGRPRIPNLIPTVITRIDHSNDNSSDVGEATPVRYSSNVFIMEQGSDVLHPAVIASNTTAVSRSSQQRPPQVRRSVTMDYGSVPQIIVSDDANHPIDANSNNNLVPNNAVHFHFDVPAAVPEEGSRGGRRGSLDGGSTSLGGNLSVGGGSHEEGDSPASSLNLPVQRPRSRSVPSIVFPLPAIAEGSNNGNRSSQRRPSYCAEKDQHPKSLHHSPPSSTHDLHVPTGQDRGRRHSFSGINPAMRRGSIAELWGSKSERERHRLKGGLWGTNGSVELDQAFRELLIAKGVLESSSSASRISVEQWEALRKCRYLRIPDRDKAEQEEAERL